MNKNNAALIVPAITLIIVLALLIKWHEQRPSEISCEMYGSTQLQNIPTRCYEYWKGK